MGQVCAKHREFYETECRWCEKPAEPAFPAFTWMRIPVARPVCDHNKSGICAGCGADILPVSAQIPVFKRARDPSFAECLGAEEIGPQESKFWMDFISQAFCLEPKDKHGGCE